MTALGIVVTDVFDDRLPCLRAGLEVHIMDAFDFPRAIDRLSRHLIRELHRRSATRFSQSMQAAT
jgi:hypothetical protein